MVQKHLVDNAEMKSLLHLISHVLPNQLGPRCQMQEIIAYNREVMETFEQRPHFPLPSKDCLSASLSAFLYLDEEACGPGIS